MRKYLYLLFVFFLFSCKEEIKENVVFVKTMGTTGTIKYISKHENFQKQIDSILVDVNMSLSTYIDSSTLSLYNSRKISLAKALKDDFFRYNYKTSEIVWQKTNHKFNPAIMPLVQYWKVQNKAKETYALEIDSILIDSLVELINTDIVFTKSYKSSLDFSAIAKGYGVDKVAAFLENKGIKKE